MISGTENQFPPITEKLTTLKHMLLLSLSLLWSTVSGLLVKEGGLLAVPHMLLHKLYINVPITVLLHSIRRLEKWAKRQNFSNFFKTYK